MKDDLKLQDLGMFYGTTRYYDVMSTRVTDGIKYIMNNGYSWLVTDALICMRSLKKLNKQPFLTVKLKLMTGTNKGKAHMIIEDGNNKELYRQLYTMTDAERELTLFYTDGVLMLSGEY